LIGTANRLPSWPLVLRDLLPQPLAERMSRRTPQSAGSAELATGSWRQGYEAVGGLLTSGQGDKSAPARASNTPCPLAAVALAIDLDDRAVVHQSVHRCHGHGAGGEDVLPLAERLV